MFSIKYRMSFIESFISVIESLFIPPNFLKYLIAGIIIVFLIYSQIWLIGIIVFLILICISLSKNEMHITINESTINIKANNKNKIKSSKVEQSFNIDKVKYAIKTKKFYLFFIEGGSSIEIPICKLNKNQIEFIEKMIKKNKLIDNYFTKKYNYLFILNFLSYPLAIIFSSIIFSYNDVKNIPIKIVILFISIFSLIISIITFINAIKMFKKNRYKRNIILSVIFSVIYILYMLIALMNA